MATAADVLAVAMKEIGTVEQSGNRQKYGKAYGMDGVYWCMQFSSGGASSRWTSRSLCPAARRPPAVS